MKNAAKKLATSSKNQQARKDTRNEANEKPSPQGSFDESGSGEANKADARNAPRQASRSGRKSRDNFGSYKGY